MKVLISLFNAAGYGGAATVALELAEAFIDRGDSVDFCAWWAAAPMASHFSDAGVRRLEDLGAVNPFDYDLVIFMHHSAPLHFATLRSGKVARTLILFFRLSHSSNIGVPSPILEDLIADHWFVNSDEVRDRMVHQFGLDPKLIFNFCNAAPQRFARHARRTPQPLQRVIYISNHHNADVIKALRVLRESFGIQTVHYGSGGDVQTRITPREISHSDVVITMAKSAQFALLSRIPVYVYDYQWGGPGFLNEHNFDATAAANFSGSDQPRILEGEDIAAEIVMGYPTAAQYSIDLPDSLLSTYSLDRVIEQIDDLKNCAGDNALRLNQLRDHEALLNRERAYVETARHYFRRDRRRSVASQAVATPKATKQESIEIEFRSREKNIRLLGFRSDYLTQTIVRSGDFYEASMLDYIAGLNVGDAYLDVGANIGNHSVFFAVHCPSNALFAFEPFEPAFELLQQNLRRNDQRSKTKAVRAAVADQPGTCDVQVVNPKNLGMNRRTSGTETSVITLDGWLDAERPIGLIKIDVEGDEAKVLRGAIQTLGRWRPELFIEARHSSSLVELTSQLAPLGYRNIKRFNATPTYHFHAKTDP